MSGGRDLEDPRTRPDANLEDPSTRPVGALVEPTQALSDTQLRRGAEPMTGSILAEIGESVGRYRITGVLGRGGMGVVLHAHDPELERALAIKVLREQLDNPEQAPGRGLLMREARAIARVSHPNVISVYDVGLHRGRVYVAMELVEGRPLHVWMREAHPLPELLRVFAQAARGLAAAHAVGLVHRDFKPANVLVGNDGRVRVLDFGLARGLGDPNQLVDARGGPRTETGLSGEEITSVGTLAGTPAYMSPEQFDAGEADLRSDQFAFCVSLHEALFGTRPFTGDTLWELREAVIRKPLTLPSSAEALPVGLRELLHRGLAKHAAERFDSMASVVENLDELCAALESSPEAAPIIAPLGFTSASASSSKNLLSSKRLSSYLGTLPRGLDSHPQCSMHGSALRLALARHPLAETDELPDQVRASLADLARADPENPWLGEVPARVVLAAIFDLRVRSLRAWDELWFAIARARFTRQFMGFATPRDGSSLAASLARLWNDFHRGTTLELHPSEGGLSLHLSYPSDLLDPLAHTEALQLVRAGLELSGRTRVELRGVEHDSRQLRAVVAYR
jgi:serine/threonine protein kinase